MCLVLKLVNDKMVPIANEQAESHTDRQCHPVPYSNVDLTQMKTLFLCVSTYCVGTHTGTQSSEDLTWVNKEENKISNLPYICIA